MEPISDLLLDTHIVMWMAIDPDRIPLPLLEGIEAAKHCFVSHVTALEIQWKALKSRRHFTFSLGHLERTMREFSLKELPIVYQDIKRLGEMTFLHRDPFDRLLMAQAAQKDLPLVTVDKDILLTFKRYKQFRAFK